MSGAAAGHRQQVSADELGALGVLRRGLGLTPELRKGFASTAVMALVSAAGRLTIPILVQVVIDRGLTDDGYRAGVVFGACALAAVVIAVVLVLSRWAYTRLVLATELALRRLRVRTFAHVQGLSLADHTGSRRGTLVSRVTSDVEQLAMFAQWGAVAWVVNGSVIIGTIVLMAIYSWQLTLVVLATYVPIIPYLRWMQRGQLRSYDLVRTRVGETLGTVSELVTGASVIRAYGYEEPVRRGAHAAIDRQYRSQMGAYKWFSLALPVVDMVGVLALATVIGVGAWWGPDWGLTPGQLVAFVFLVNLVLQPVTELGEVLDTTQTAIAGWRKILAVHEQPLEIVDPVPGEELAPGVLAVSVTGVTFSYRDGPVVLDGIDVVIPAGAAVAVVGETGSGKTTFARLLVRLADPTGGEVRVGGHDLRAVSGPSRRRAVRMVPQDGFLFDTSVRENVRLGRERASDSEIEAAFAALGLRWWLERLPKGLDTPVGERGEALSVGERQLVALARAQLADPGLLILDEATSAVDPETEQALAEALRRLSAGRTTVSIAHRLSTAEAADLVLVFDAGRIVERGHHDELVAAGGIYAGLYRSWLGNTREANAVTDETAEFTDR